MLLIPSAQGPSPSSPSRTMQSRNNVQFTRTMLLDLLDDLQQRTLQVFGCQIRLFVHGGAVMLLHPLLSASSTRRTTRDIDYIRRAFGHEWRKQGIHDAEDRLQSCIDATARRFRVGYVCNVLHSNDSFRAKRSLVQIG